MIVTFFTASSFASQDCLFDLSVLRPHVRNAVKVIQLRDALAAKQKQDANFAAHIPTEEIVKHLFILAEGWRLFVPYDRDPASLKEISAALGHEMPTTKLFFFHNDYDFIDLLGRELVERDIPWAERTRLFRRYVLDDRVVENILISVYALDPLLGINSVDAARSERAIFGEVPTSETQADQKMALGGEPEFLWSNYGWLTHLLRPKFFVPGESLVDIGSGVGRVGAFIAAMHPSIRFTGLEINEGRLKIAQAWAQRFGLDRIVFRQSDLEFEDLPAADHYYYFNSLPDAAYERMLSFFKAGFDRGRSFTVYVAHDPKHQIWKQDYLKDLETVYVPEMKWYRDPATTELYQHPQRWPMRILGALGQ